MVRVPAAIGRLLLSCPLPAALLDGEGRVVDVNDALRALAPAARAAAGAELWRVLDPDASAVHHPAAAALRSGERRYQGEWALADPRGTTRRVVATIWPAAERPRIFFAQFLDVTERTASEQALRERERALRLALDAGQMGVWQWDVVSGRTEVSPELTRLHGVEPAAFPPGFDGYMTLVHPDDREPLRQAVAHGIETGGGHNVEYRVIRPDGEVRWMLGKGSAERNVDGRAVMLSGICADVTERKKFEEELRRRDERHRAFVATSSEAIWRFELDRGIAVGTPTDDQVAAMFAQAYLAECNDAMARMYGFEQASDIVGTRLTEMVDPAEPLNREYLRQFVDSGYRLNGYDSYETDRHGRRKFFRNSLVGIVEDGALVRAWGTQVDVTAQKQAEERLRASEARFRLMADHAPVLIWLSDTNNLGTFFNRPWLDFTGAPLHEQLGAGWLGFVHADDRPQVAATCQEQFDRRAPFIVEFRLRRHDGEYRWVLDQGTPLIDADGGFAGYIGACVDITELKAAQDREAFLARAGQVLTSSLDYRETLVRVANLAVPFLADWCTVDMITDDGVERLAVAHQDAARAGDILRMTMRSPTIWQGALAEMIRAGVPVLVPRPADEQLAAAALDAEHLTLLRSLVRRPSIVAPFVARERVLGAITLVAPESGRTYGDTDVRLAGELAARVAAAIDNARLYEEAQMASRAKDDFLARLSHELRTPLNVALGWTQMLRGVTAPERLQRGLDLIERNTRALTLIIEDLLDFSRNVRAGLRIEPVPIDLSDVVQQALVSVEPLAVQKGVELTLASEGPVPITGDPARLQQVAWNLLTNGIKFTPPGGRVSAAVGPADDGAEVRVSDTGQGIRPELLDAIFDPFRQGAAHGTPGLGLGLAIVRQIVEAHGGVVRAHSGGEGAGATFVFRLPARLTSPVLPQPAPGTSVPAHRHPGP